MWCQLILDTTYTTNYSVEFPTTRTDSLLRITQWQYWWWFWFTYFLVLYYFLLLRLFRFRTLKFRPKIATTTRSHGKWGDLIVCLLPISWCANILTNSNLILRMLEWQSESSLFTVRVRGKQWYWIYKFELKTITDILSAPKNIGHNKWFISFFNDLKVADDYLHIMQLRSQNNWVDFYWNSIFERHLKEPNFYITSPQELLILDYTNFIDKKKKNSLNFWKNKSKYTLRENPYIDASFNSRYNTFLKSRGWILASFNFFNASGNINNIIVNNINFKKTYSVCVKGCFRISSDNFVVHKNPRLIDFFEIPLNFSSNDLPIVNLNKKFLKISTLNSSHIKNSLIRNFFIKTNTSIINYNNYDYLDINRWLKFSDEIQSPIRLIKTPLKYNNFNDQSFKLHNQFKLFRLKYNDSADLLQHKPLPHSTYLVYKQKRYQRKDKFIPKDQFFYSDLTKKSIFDVIDPKIFFEKKVKLILSLKKKYSYWSITNFVSKFSNISKNLNTDISFIPKSISVRTLPSFRYNFYVCYLSYLKQTIKSFKKFLETDFKVDINPFLKKLIRPDVLNRFEFYDETPFFKKRRPRYKNFNYYYYNQKYLYEGCRLFLTPYYIRSINGYRIFSQIYDWNKKKTLKRGGHFLKVEASKLEPFVVFPKTKDKFKLKNLNSGWHFKNLKLMKIIATTMQRVTYNHKPKSLMDIHDRRRSEYHWIPLSKNLQPKLPKHSLIEHIFGKVFPKYPRVDFSRLSSTMPSGGKLVAMVINGRVYPRRPKRLLKTLLPNIQVDFLKKKMSEEIVMFPNSESKPIFGKRAWMRWNISYKKMKAYTKLQYTPSNKLDKYYIESKKNKNNSLPTFLPKISVKMLRVLRTRITSNFWIIHNSKYSIEQGVNWFTRNKHKAPHIISNYSPNFFKNALTNFFNQLDWTSLPPRLSKIYFPEFRKKIPDLINLKTIEIILKHHFYKHSNSRVREFRCFSGCYKTTTHNYFSPYYGPEELILGKMLKKNFFQKFIFNKYNWNYNVNEKQLKNCNTLILQAKKLLENTKLDFLKLKESNCIDVFAKTDTKNILKKKNFNTYLFGNQLIIDNLNDSFINYRFLKKNKNISENASNILNRRLLRTKRTLVLPVNINITIITNSYDVVHSWFIPGLGLKLDCIPGRATHHTLNIENVGFYYGQCAEICGRYHHHMPIRVCALPFEHFLVWWHTFGLPKMLYTNSKFKNLYLYSKKKYTW